MSWQPAAGGFLVGGGKGGGGGGGGEPVSPGPPTLKTTRWAVITRQSSGFRGDCPRPANHHTPKKWCCHSNVYSYQKLEYIKIFHLFLSEESVTPSSYHYTFITKILYRTVEPGGGAFSCWLANRPPLSSIHNTLDQSEHLASYPAPITAPDRP